MVKDCLFPVAGLGSRFLPATREIPKEMIPLLDRPVIHWGVQEAVDSGCSHMVFVTSRHKKCLEDYFDRNVVLEDELAQKGKDEALKAVRATAELASVTAVRQSSPLGLGHAVLCGEPICSGDFFAVALPDDVMTGPEPVLKQLIDAHKRTGGSVVALEVVEPSQVNRYGVVSGSEVESGLWRLDNLVEKPQIDKAPSNLAVMGRYVLSRTIFSLLKDTPRGAGGEIQLTDGIRELARRESVYGLVYRGERFDCGTTESWLQSTLRLMAREERYRSMIESCLL